MKGVYIEMEGIKVEVEVLVRNKVGVFSVTMTRW